MHSPYKKLKFSSESSGSGSSASQATQREIRQQRRIQRREEQMLERAIEMSRSEFRVSTAPGRRYISVATELEQEEPLMEQPTPPTVFNEHGMTYPQPSGENTYSDDFTRTKTYAEWKNAEYRGTSEEEARAEFNKMLRIEDSTEVDARDTEVMARGEGAIPRLSRGGILRGLPVRTSLLQFGQDIRPLCSRFSVLTGSLIMHYNFGRYSEERMSELLNKEAANARHMHDIESDPSREDDINKLYRANVLLARALGEQGREIERLRHTVTLFGQLIRGPVFCSGFRACSLSPRIAIATSVCTTDRYLPNDPREMTTGRTRTETGIIRKNVLVTWTGTQYTVDFIASNLTQRLFHTVTKMDDGEAVVIGGFPTNPATVSGLIHPETLSLVSKEATAGTWIRGGDSLLSPLYFHTSTRLRNTNYILVAGGLQRTFAQTYMASGEYVSFPTDTLFRGYYLYNIDTQLFEIHPQGAPETHIDYMPRPVCQHAAVEVVPGIVMFIGGSTVPEANRSTDIVQLYLHDVETTVSLTTTFGAVVDIENPTWLVCTHKLRRPRRGCSAIFVPNNTSEGVAGGMVLVHGGIDDQGAVCRQPERLVIKDNATLQDIVNAEWQIMPEMQTMTLVGHSVICFD